MKLCSTWKLGGVVKGLGLGPQDCTRLHAAKRWPHSSIASRAFLLRDLPRVQAIPLAAKTSVHRRFSSIYDFRPSTISVYLRFPSVYEFRTSTISVRLRVPYIHDFGQSTSSVYLRYPDMYNFRLAAISAYVAHFNISRPTYFLHASQQSWLSKKVKFESAAAPRAT